MLANDLLFKAPKQSAILRYVVSAALASEEIREKEIAFEVFGGYDIDSAKVRVNVSLLRARMRDYYTGAGREDLVVISLPSGPAYRPVFSYHQLSRCLAHYRRGLAHLHDPLRSAQEIFFAINEFKAATGAEPAFAPAYVRKAEAQILKGILQGAFDFEGEFPPNYDRPDLEVEKALQINPGLASAHIIRGVTHATCGEWGDAEADFATALTIDSGAVRQSWWYAAYLLTIGRWDEAFAIARPLVMQHPESRNAELLYALFLYIARQFDDAFKLAFAPPEFVRPAEERPLAKLLIGLSLLGRGTLDDCKSALTWLKSASEVPASELDEGRFFKEKPERYVGLMMCCLARLAKEVPPKVYPPNWPEIMIEPSFVEQRAKLVAQYAANDCSDLTPFQAAIFHMAVGNTTKAFTALHASGGDASNILMTWLHWWPIFDPLRKYKRFSKIIGKFGILPPGIDSQ